MVVRVVKASNLSGGSVAAYVVVELDEPGQRWGHTVNNSSLRAAGRYQYQD